VADEVRRICAALVVELLVKFTGLTPRCFLLFLATSGYGKYYKSLREYLNSQLGDQIEMVPLEDRGTTGNFEVTVLGSGELLYSKRQMGGRATSEAERMVIVDQIKELLD
jgi:hypothetical protein